MPESEVNFEHQGRNTKKKEYNFDEGAAAIVEKIESLLAVGQEYVVVSIAGSHIEVGKSRLTAEISKSLKQKSIAVEICGNAGSIWTIKDAIKFNKKQSIDRIVIIFEADTRLAACPKEDIEQIRAYDDRDLQKQANQAGLPLNKVDIRVNIYRPDRPFESREGCETFADITIRNEQARDRL